MFERLLGGPLELLPISALHQLGLGASFEGTGTTSDGRVATRVVIDNTPWLLVERRSPYLLERPLIENEVGLWEYDLATQATRWNTHMHRLTGLERPTPAEKWLDFTHPDDRPLVTHTMRDTFALGRFTSVPHRFLRPDGQSVWLISFGKVITGPSGAPTGLVGGCIDVSEHRGQEQMLSSAKRLESVGQMTAGITHNINNLLAVILPALDLAEELVVGEARDAIDEAKHASLRAKELIRQIMAFSRPRERRVQQESIDIVVGRVVSMVQRFFEASVRVDYFPGSNDAVVSGDITQLEQAVMNLLVNARDAMRDADIAHPHIEVRTQRRAPLDAAGAAPVACISVKDNGPGIPTEIQGRLFEPFFTTKGPDKGTGLGLATVLATAEHHQGSVRFESKVGEGTTFELSLPLADHKS